MTLMKQHTKTNKMICLSSCGCLGLKLELGLGEEPRLAGWYWYHQKVLGQTKEWMGI